MIRHRQGSVGADDRSWGMAPKYTPLHRSVGREGTPETRTRSGEIIADASYALVWGVGGCCWLLLVVGCLVVVGLLLIGWLVSWLVVGFERCF